MPRQKVSGWRRLGRWIRYQFLKMLRENSSPAQTALGLGLGSFIGIFPSFLIGSPLAFFLAGRFGWNRAAAPTGTFLTNPITAPLFYTISTWLGLSILGDRIQDSGQTESAWHFGFAFLIGNTLFAFFCASLLAMGVFFAVRQHHKTKAVTSLQIESETAASSETVVPTSHTLVSMTGSGVGGERSKGSPPTSSPATELSI